MATNDRESIPPLGREVSRTKADCLECGRPIMVVEYERGVGCRYCEPCRQARDNPSLLVFLGDGG